MAGCELQCIGIYRCHSCHWCHWCHRLLRNTGAYPSQGGSARGLGPLLPGSAPRPRVSYEECPGDRHAGIPRGVSMDSTSLTAMTAFNARDTSDASDTAINAPACTLHPAKLSAVWGKFEN